MNNHYHTVIRLSNGLIIRTICPISEVLKRWDYFCDADQRSLDPKLILSISEEPNL